MGMFDRFRGKSMEDPVRGTARVLENFDGQDAQSALTRATMKLSVSAEGLDPTEVEWTGMVKAHKWPRRSVQLPVTVDRANPENIEIHWDEAPNVVKQAIGSTMGDLAPDQRETVETTQANAMKHADALLALNKQYSAGEIDQDELFRRQAEIMELD